MPWVCRVLLAVLLAGVATARAQTAPVGEAQPPAPANEDQAARLERYRGFITNVADSKATRVAQAEELLQAGGPGAAELVVTLLTTGDEPTTKLVLCQAIGNVGRQRPEVLDARFVDPLLAQLGSGSDEVAARAAEALATFPDGHVAQALGELAADASASPGQRRFAVSALGYSTHRREVVAELVKLLDTPEPSLVAQVTGILKRVSNETYDADIEGWRRWWEKQAALSESDWLKAQLKLRTQRLRQTEQELADLQSRAQQKYDHLASRLTQVLTELYRLAPAANRDALLESWFGDSTTEYRLVAAALVAEQISEGNLPSETLRAALRRRYTDESPQVRRQAIEIVGALNDPAETGPILARVDAEQDRAVRETILRVLGKLRNPEAIAPLLAELKRSDAPDGCVAAAADALGMLAARGRVDEETVSTIIAPLRARFALSAEGPPAVRVALLGAMAAIGSPAFKPEFDANLSVEDPELLLRAIQGIALVGNGEQLDRLSNLTAHADARVRHRALAALGELGSADQLSTIIARLSPSVETVEGARKAAWSAFKMICGRLSPADQVAAADRLADQPALAADYLQALQDRMSPMKPPPPELPAVRERLAGLYVALGRNAEALPLWRQLFAAADPAQASRYHQIALALLQCALASGNTDQLETVLAALTTADETMRRSATTALTAHLDRLLVEGRQAEAQTLARKFESVPADAFAELKSYLSLHFSAADANTNSAASGG